MMRTTFSKLASAASFATLAAICGPAFSQDMREPMSEADLRELVTFGPDDFLKYAECEKKSYPTCTYIWGVFDSDDETRIKLGGNPDGAKLLTVFAQAHRLEDFKRVRSVTPDAEDVAGVGIAAIWSAKRRQLSLMTEAFLVIHVNVDVPDLEDPQATAMQVAHFLTGQE